MISDQAHADKIEWLAQKLNEAVNEAARDGLTVGIETVHRNIISGHESVPFVAPTTYRRIFAQEESP